MKIRVVDISETKLLTLRQSYVRYSIYILWEVIVILVVLQLIDIGKYSLQQIEDIMTWMIIIWFVIDALGMATNNKRRTLHDLLAGSVVIREEYWQNEPSSPSENNAI